MRLSGKIFKSCPVRGELVLSVWAVVTEKNHQEWRKCSRECAGDVDCKAWSWNIRTRQCYISEEDPSDIDILVSSYVSGAKECSGQDFLLETAVSDAGAESQHWTIHLNRISLHGTDFYLERSQSLTPPSYQTTVTGPSMVFKWNFETLGRRAVGNHCSSRGIFS